MNLSVELKELIAKDSTLNTSDLATLCQVNKVFNAITTRLLYHHVTVRTPRGYLALKNTLSTVQELREYIHRLDLSGYSAKGSRLSEEKATQLIIPHQLVQMVRDCDNLKELLIGEEMMSLVGASIYRAQSIFTHSSQLETIDFTGFCNRDYEPPSHYPYMNSWPIPKTLKNVSFYMSITLDLQNFLVPFFKRLERNRNQLERLDLGHTTADSSIFSHLQSNNSLTHLSIKGCFSINCCSPFIDYIHQNGSKLVHLNLDMLNRGRSAPFCDTCLFTIMESLNRNTIESLDLGGHPFLDDMILHGLLEENDTPFTRLTHLSLALTGIDTSKLRTLLSRLFPKLYYINLTKQFFNDYDYGSLTKLFADISDSTIQVVEIALYTPIKYPARVDRWILGACGRRLYYSREGVDPSFAFAKKMILIDQQQLTRMNKYLCYEY